MLCQAVKTWLVPVESTLSLSIPSYLMFTVTWTQMEEAGLSSTYAKMDLKPSLMMLLLIMQQVWLLPLTLNSWFLSITSIFLLLRTLVITSFSLRWLRQSKEPFRSSITSSWLVLGQIHSSTRMTTSNWAQLAILSKMFNRLLLIKISLVLPV